MSEDHRTDPCEEAVAAAFASYRADAAAQFAPPSADELIMSGPAKLRRRRIVSLAAVVGAATAVTAGGFAVAQTIGSPPEGADKPDTPSAVHGNSSSEQAPGTHSGDPTTPETGDQSPSAPTSEIPLGDGEDQVLVLEDWDEDCEGGTFAFDPSVPAFAEDTDWTVEASASGDLTGDDTPEAVLVLSCGGERAVAAFTAGDDGLEHLGWVWRPDGSSESVDTAEVADGAVALGGRDGDDAWTARYEWDGEAFVPVDEEPSNEPSSPDAPDTTDPAETQPTQPTPTGDGQGP